MEEGALNIEGILEEVEYEVQLVIKRQEANRIW
jgi:hypothetical protein